MKKGKVSSVYDGWAWRKGRVEQEAESREARRKAKARMNIRRWQMILRSMSPVIPHENSHERGEEKGVLALGDIFAKEELRKKKKKKKHVGDTKKEKKDKEKKGEETTDGDKTLEADMVEELPTKCCDEEWWMRTVEWVEGWECWWLRGHAVGGCAGFNADGYVDKEGLDWEDDLWNLRGTQDIPKL